MIWRYLLPAGLMLAAVSTWFLTGRSGAGDEIAGAAGWLSLLLYVLASAWWSFAAARDRRRLSWRLLMPWAPIVAPLAFTVWATPGLGGDDTGFGAMLGLGLTLVVAFFSLCASAYGLMARVARDGVRMEDSG